LRQSRAVAYRGKAGKTGLSGAKKKTAARKN
jgi:hypothetical protein